MSNKHMKEEPFKIGKFLKITFIFVLLLTALVSIGTIIYVKFSEREEENRANQISTTLGQRANLVYQTVKENKLSTLQTIEVDIPEKQGDYNVLGVIEIPKIKVKLNILDETTDESLNLSVTRFWGDKLHGVGNFSIIGHNYKGMFKDLKKLEIGDTFTIVDREGSICTYEVYEIYIVEPDDVSCIEDTLLGQREVTLITCTTGGAKRLILKAKEQK